MADKDKEKSPPPPPITEAEEKIREAADAAKPASAYEIKEEEEKKHALTPRLYHDHLVWPADCPIDVLGVSENAAQFYFKTAQGGFAVRSIKELNKTGIASLFLDKTAWLYECFHEWKKNKAKEMVPDFDRFKVDKFANLIIQEGGRNGVFKGNERIFGRGCWGEVGNTSLFVNCGDKIYEFPVDAPMDPAGMDPGVIGKKGKKKDTRKIYQIGETLPHIRTTKPDDKNFKDAVELIIGDIRSWNWKDDAESPSLVLGFMVCMFFGGALPWRPHMWLTAAEGSGKSEFQHMVKNFLNGWSFHTESATEPGLRQHVGYSSLPIQYDEAEGTDFSNSKHIQEVIGFMRLASGGSVSHKGTVDQTGAEFRLNSCMLFSSIFMPGLTAADRGRLMIHQLLPLERGTHKRKIKKSAIEKAGSIIISHFCFKWREFEKYLNISWNWLSDDGLSSRDCDVYAMPCAFSCLMLMNEVSSMNLSGLFPDLADRVKSERDAHEGVRCLNYLLEQSFNFENSVGTVHGRIKILIDKNLPIVHEVLDDSDEDRNLKPDRDFYSEALASAGLIFYPDTNSLFVANTHSVLFRFFQETPWRGTVKGSAGAWKDALGRTPGAKLNVRRYISGHHIHGTLVSLEGEKDKPAIADTDITL